MNRRERIEERYQKNIARLPECCGYLFSQRAFRCRDLLFGEKGNVGANGCGAVAIHNAMKRVGKEQNFCDVLRDMEELHMTWLSGLFGTKPWSLCRYFRRKKVPCWKYSSPNDFKAALLSHPAGIVCTWNKRFHGMHFYCIYYSAEDQTYYTANFRSTGERFRPTKPEEISNLRFAVGYIVNTPEGP